MVGLVNQVANISAPEAGSGVLLGHHSDGTPCYYDPARLINGHACMLGMSGAGKSHLIRYLISQLCQAWGITTFLYDLQGDLGGIPGANDVVFHYGDDAIACVNPLRIDADPRNGGVHMAVRQSVNILRMFNPHMGTRQESDLAKLLERTFAAVGISQADPASWSKPTPCLSDVLREVSYARAEATTGLLQDEAERIRALRKKIRKLRDKEYTDDNLDQKEADNEELERLEEELTKLVLELVVEGNDKDKGPRWDLKRLDGIEHLLQSVVKRRLFNGDDMPIRVQRINRFDLNPLHEVDRKVMLHVLLERAFDYARRTCRVLNPPMPRIMVVLDEGKYASTWMEDLLSPLNKIATEGRKYGLGLIMGVQSIRHLSDDAADNFAMTMVLKLTDKATERAAKLFRVPEAVLESMEVRHHALVGFNGSRFRKIALADFGPSHR